MELRSGLGGEEGRIWIARMYTSEPVTPKNGKT